MPSPMLTRRALAGTTALAGVGVLAAACTAAVTPAVIATVSAAAQAGATALLSIITDIQGMIANTTGLTPTAIGNLTTQIAALQAQVTILLTPIAPTAVAPVSSVFATVTGIMQAIGQYLPLVLPIIALLAKPGAPPLTAAQASLLAHYQALRAAAGA